MYRYLLATFFILQTACSPEESAPTYPLDSALLVEIKEIRLMDKKHIVLSCRTRKIYECSNYNLKTAVQLTAGSIQVEFLGVNPDRFCAEALGPAQAELDLGMLANGQYQVKLIKQAQYQGILKVSATTLELVLPFSQGIEIVNPVFSR